MLLNAAATEANGTVTVKDVPGSANVRPWSVALSANETEKAPPTVVDGTRTVRLTGVPEGETVTVWAAGVTVIPGGWTTFTWTVTGRGIWLVSVTVAVVDAAGLDRQRSRHGGGHQRAHRHLGAGGKRGSRAPRTRHPRSWAFRVAVLAWAASGTVTVHDAVIVWWAITCDGTLPCGVTIQPAGAWRTASALLRG